jgi:prepilin-type N-terminal cleavage/methylation domain-containing protein/prepilin-type processing-associated H-X9-DG protein
MTGTSRKAAFTLMEVLIAISLVSLLTGILVPVTQAAMARARRLQCQTNTSHLSKGVSVWAMTANGQAPVGPLRRRLWGAPYELYRRQADPRLLTPDGWFGLGRLFRDAVIAQGRSFYCPAAERSGGVPFEQAWPVSANAGHFATDGKRKIYSHFAYRGGAGCSSEGRIEPLKLDRLAPDLALVTDDPCSGRRWHADGYNVGFVDGSSRYVEADQPVQIGGMLPLFWTRLGPRQSITMEP